MKISVFLHSTTGNTRLITHYAAQWLKNKDHDVSLQDIVKTPSPADLKDTDLLVISNPSMYFRPTVAMERFVAQIPSLPLGEKRPAFLLGTCMGEPGAHFALLAEALEPKGWQTLGAHWVLFPSSYPTHLAAVKPLSGFFRLRSFLDTHLRPLRPLWWSIWPNGEPDEGDREELHSALRGLLHVLQHHKHNLHQLHRLPNDLYDGIPTCNAQGRLFPVEKLDRIVNIQIDETKCIHCGICVKRCPAEVLTQKTPHTPPRVGKGCTGCFACYNHCPENAISAVATPQGKGVYRGPTPSMKKLFSLPKNPNEPNR